MIGDTARDILTAHQARIPSIAVTWGSTSSIEQIAQAEPTRIASDFQDLEYKIADFEEGVFNYKSRTKHRDYMMLPESQRNKILSVKIENKYLGEFCSYKKDKRDIHSNLVRAFDQSRDVSVKDIQTGCRKEYFAGGIVRQGEVFNDVLENFKDRMSRLILSFNLKGSTGIIAAPNSCPEYCYKSDPHQNLVEDVAKITGCKCRDINSEYRRVVNRVFPKVSSHTGGGRGIFNHYKTMGFSPIMDLSSLNNIVIFDNVKTTGSQIKSMAFFLYHFGFRGKFCSATLAYTSLKDFEESNI